MSDPNLIYDIISSDRYRHILLEVCASLGLEYRDEIPDVLIKRDAANLNSAQLAASDLKGLIDTDAKKFMAFAVQKYKALRNEIDDGEFPADEPQDASEKGKVVEYLPMYANFLISYMVEYILAVRHPNDLLPYLKKMRIPFASKYSAQLKNWVNN